MKKIILVSILMTATSSFGAQYTCKAELKHKALKTSTVMVMPESTLTELGALSSVIQIENVKFSAYERNNGDLSLNISKEQPGNTITPFFTISNTQTSVPASGKTTSNGVYLSDTDKAIISCTSK